MGGLALCCGSVCSVPVPAVLDRSLLAAVPMRRICGREASAPARCPASAAYRIGKSASGANPVYIGCRTIQMPCGFSYVPCPVSILCAPWRRLRAFMRSLPCGRPASGGNRPHAPEKGTRTWPLAAVALSLHTENIRYAITCIRQAVAWKRHKQGHNEQNRKERAILRESFQT